MPNVVKLGAYETIAREDDITGREVEIKGLSPDSPLALSCTSLYVTCAYAEAAKCETFKLVKYLLS